MHGVLATACLSTLTWGTTSLLTCALAAERDEPVAEPGDEIIEEVIVTGTRLPIQGTAPVTVLDRGDIERGGANSIGDVLHSLPMNAGSTLNTNVNMAGEPVFGAGRGDGSVRIALRGHSTLVLLNGRRFPNSGEGADASVDLNTLPISFVERVEVLASGASAIYGSGAVGGVVNVITRRDVVGFTFAGSQKLSKHGDGAVTTGQAAAGLDLFGGTWILGVEHVEQDGVTLDRRDYSAVPLVVIDADGTLAPFPNRALPEGRFEVPDGNALGFSPGAYTRVDGATGRTAADYRLIDPAADFFNVAPYNYSQTPNERSALWLIGSHPLGERLTLFVEGLGHHRESAQESAPDGYFGMAAPMLADGSTGIPADNHYNPFTVDLFRTSRRMVAFGNRGFREEVDLWRLLVGLEGRVADWRWTVSVANAESDALTVETGVTFRSRLIPAIGPSGPDQAGKIVCGPADPLTGVVPAASIIAGCVPIDLFGGPGSITPDQLGLPQSRTHAAYRDERGTDRRSRSEWSLGTVVRTGSALGSGPGLPARSRLLRVGPAACRRNGGTRPRGRRLWREGAVCRSAGAATQGRALGAGARPEPWREVVGATLRSIITCRGRPACTGNLSRNGRCAPITPTCFQAPELWDLDQSRKRVGAIDFDPCGDDPTEAQRANCAANGVPGGAYVQDEAELNVLRQLPEPRARNRAQHRRRPAVHTWMGRRTCAECRLVPRADFEPHQPVVRGPSPVQLHQVRTTSGL